jgi:hypothetical protein
MKARAFYLITLWAGIIPIFTGSVIFWTWFFCPGFRDLQLAGLVTIIASVPVCLIALILGLYTKHKNKEDDNAVKKTKRVIMLLLANIPLAIFYVWFATYIIDSERITLINNTEQGITNIYVYGSGDAVFAPSIKKGGSKFFWIHMTKEGSIKLIYEKEGQKMTGSLAGYTGPGMGGHWHKRHIYPTNEEISNSY